MQVPPIAQVPLLQVRLQQSVPTLQGWPATLHIVVDAAQMCALGSQTCEQHFVPSVQESPTIEQLGTP
jgi:hypothetical protein